MSFIGDVVRLPFQVLLSEETQDRLHIRTLEAERRARVLRHLDGLVLDIGCGRNRLLLEYRALGGRGYGCDVYRWGPLDVQADGSSLPFRDAAFDTISLVACLNHIPDRERCMEEVARVLRPGGRVVLTMISPLVGRLAHALSWWDPYTHSREFEEGERHGLREAELRRVAEHPGLRYVGRERFLARMNTLYVFDRPTSGR